MSKIQAVILAGGKGSRLRPYTTVLPKPLMPLVDMPIAEVIIRQLKAHKITNIAISTGHLSKLIEAYFGDGKKWGVKITYVHEDEPLGTAGALRLVKNIENDFLVINGDVLTTMNFSKLLKVHKQKRNIATISVKARSIKNEFGVVKINQNNELVDYIEKPQHRSYVSIGVNIINKKAIKYVLPKKVFGMPELMLALRDSKEKVGCYKIKDTWLDLGRFEDFEAAQELFNKNRKKFLLS